MNLAFRVHIEKNIGLGHFKRLDILKKKLRQNVTWIVSGDEKIIYSNLKKNKNLFIVQSLNDEKKLAYKLYKNNFQKIVFDIANEKFLKNNFYVKIISVYKKFNFKIISYDLPNKKSLSDVSIIPYNFNNKLNKKKNSINFFGSDYYLNKNTKIKKNIIKKKVKNILITIGGSDFKSIGYEIAKILKDENFKIRLLCGLNDIGNDLNDVKNIKFVDDIEAYLKWSDLVICGEGLTKYEVIFQNKPFVMIHQFDVKSIMIKSFLKEDLCLSLGIYNKKKLNDYKKKILYYVNNKDLISKHLKKQIKIYGNERAYKNKEKLIKEIKK